MNAPQAFPFGGQFPTGNPGLVGYLPPCNVEAEQSVIGGLLIQPERLHDIPELRAEHFHHEAHRLAFSAITRLVGANRPADAVSVMSDLDAHAELDAAGGMTYLTQLAQNVPSAANIRRYTEIVTEHALERSLLTAAAEISDLAVERSGRTLAERQAEAIRLLSSVTDEATTEHEPVSMALAVQTATKEMMDRLDRGDVLGGLSTGLAGLDAILDGLKPGDLIVIGGRPSMGKSALGLSIALENGLNGQPAQYNSLEMQAAKLSKRAIAGVGGISLTRMKSGQMQGTDYSAYTVAATRLSDAPIWIEDKAGQTVERIAAGARKQKRKRGISLLVVDHLHLIPVKGDNRAVALGRVSAGLKELAMELGIPVVILAQLNRDSAKSGTSRRPTLTDLRDSGAIEQDADVVILVHRESYYDEKANPNEAELIVAKHRDGETGTVRVGWQPECTRFTDTPPDWSPAMVNTAKQYWQEADL
ncbi:replicative DNA helicase [Chitinimonas sp. BJB300]|uniref:replicative DNA helicase n=1 Tax=Chitinimonas sp. BJB300 TaxID=1559339 RepID=UPI000C114416|nr:replicative DNA helicase [Chitinimonas sp. BJB300]PHV12086.1 DNA helicase [Chitinimonas sp. BJB300]TSJ87310.1 replicative DNA helicase [Chitinimonas sp. BJB300]